MYRFAYYYMKFSIVIPCYNSEKYIKSCLDSIFSLNYPKKEYEVILVDGGSKDKTLEIIKKYNIRLVHSKNISISNSRNLGAKQAKGENLVFVDSDCMVEKELLNKAERYFKKYICCGSFYDPPAKAGWIAKTWLYIEGKKKGLVNWLPGCLTFVKRSAFLDVNGFNETLQTGEDFDFCSKLRKKGHQLYNDPGLLVVHLGQTDDIKNFFKKEMWRGNALIKGMKEHGFLLAELPSTIATFYHFFAILFFLISLFTTIDILIISFLLLIIPSFLLAIRKAIQTGKIAYLFKFYALIFVYQIARAVSLIRYNQLKDLF